MPARRTTGSASGTGYDQEAPDTLPVVDGVPQLGTWQSVLVIDTNVDNRLRRLRLSFLPA